MEHEIARILTPTKRRLNSFMEYFISLLMLSYGNVLISLSSGHKRTTTSITHLICVNLVRKKSIDRT